MAMIRACGFEWGSGGELDYYSVSGGGISTAWSRTGTYSFSSYITNGDGRLFFLPKSEIYAQVACHIMGNSPGLNYIWLGFLGGGNSSFAFTFAVDATSHISCYTGNGSSLKCTGTFPVVRDQDFLFEVHLKIDGINGCIETRVNGLTDSTFYGNTLTSPTSMDTIRFAYSYNATWFYDDVIVNDTTGTLNNSWPDGAKVLLLSPNAVGSTSQWNVTPPGTTHYLTVNETPPTSTGYVSSTTSGALELFGVVDTPANTGQVLFVSVDTWLQRVPGSTTSNVYTVTNCPQGLQLSQKTPATSFTLYRDQYELNPKTSSRWAVVDVNALEIGAKIV